jgi:hypothetical protein
MRACADVPVVVEICRCLDGIPLAIELAAARVDELGLRELASRLHDSFSVLTRGRRTALPRHLTIAPRLFGLVSAETLRLVNFAVIDVLAAVRRHVAVNELPPPSVEDLIARTYAALIAPARRRPRGKKSVQRGTGKRT